MAHPVAVVFSCRLDSVPSDEARTIEFTPAVGYPSGPVVVRVHLGTEISSIEIEFALLSEAATSTSDAEWAALAAELEPVAQSLATEVAVLSWRPRTNGKMPCRIMIDDGSEWSPYTLFDLALRYVGQPEDFEPGKIEGRLGQLRLEESIAGALLSEALSVRNPVAQYVCLWAALATLLDADAPSQIDATLRRRGEPLLDPIRAHDRVETRFTRLRQQIAHPVDREVSYGDLLRSAAALCEALAMIIVDIHGEGLAARRTSASS